jgi:aryl-alcohol dehydrogenase-like predicted oxidoreductase
VTCAIPGAKDVAQMTSNAGAGTGALNEDELERLDAIISRW